MKFIDSWAYALGDVLLVGGSSLPIDAAGLTRLAEFLGPGEQCTLSVTAAGSPVGNSAEIIIATGSGGGITLQRGAQGTTEREWQAGSVVCAPVTAAHLTWIYAQLADLQTRVAALEGGGGVPAGALTDETGNVLTDEPGNTLTAGA